MTERGPMVALGGASAWTATVGMGLIVRSGEFLTSLAIFCDAARNGRTAGVSPPHVPAVSGG